MITIVRKKKKQEAVKIETIRSIDRTKTEYNLCHDRCEWL